MRRFGTFTEDLEKMADWFKECGVKTVAMESTGVYWIQPSRSWNGGALRCAWSTPATSRMFPGARATCWIASGFNACTAMACSTPPSVRPDQICVLRSYLRYRDELVSARSVQCQHMQKALQQMNVQLHQVLSEITGASGLRIIEAILAGERSVQTLAALADRRVRASKATIQKALRGDYRAEHLFVLQSAFDLHGTYEKKIHSCDEQIIAQMAQLPDRVDSTKTPLPPRKAGRLPCRDMVAGKDLRQELYRCSGVDLTAIEGIGVLTAQVVLSEIGLDMDRWKTQKHFASWLGLCPDNRVSGGKVLSSHTRHVVNPMADALRIAATTLQNSKTAMGGRLPPDARTTLGRLGCHSHSPQAGSPDLQLAQARRTLCPTRHGNLREKSTASGYFTISKKPPPPSV